MIKFNDFSFKYKNSNKYALKDVDLTINPGDFIGIIGNSGAGKSTLTYSINGIIPHHFEGDFYGSVLINGNDTIECSIGDIAENVGNVFQDIDGQMVATVVEDELLFGLENFGIDKSEIPQRVKNSLESLGISHLRYRSINTLSGGQKQKVAIASIIALKPKIMVLDEPTGELDPKSSRQIFDILKKLNENFGITVVIVEQKIMLLCEFVKKLLVLDKGKIVLFGETAEILKSKRQLETIGINVPRVVTLASDLADKGLYDGEIPLDVTEAKVMVKKILSPICKGENK